MYASYLYLGSGQNYEFEVWPTAIESGQIRKKHKPEKQTSANHYMSYIVVFLKAEVPHWPPNKSQKIEKFGFGVPHGTTQKRLHQVHRNFQGFHLGFNIGTAKIWVN